MGFVVKGGYPSDQDIHLTVLVANGSVTFSNDTSAYSFRPSSSCDLLLLDAAGNSLLTLRPKRPSLHGRWEGYDGSKRIFCVGRSKVNGRSGFTAKVYDNPLAEKFEIEGSFKQRHFIVYDAGRNRSELAKISLVHEGVIDLCVKAEFDSAFSVALVVLINKIDKDAASP